MNTYRFICYDAKVRYLFSLFLDYPTLEDAKADWRNVAYKLNLDRPLSKWVMSIKVQPKINYTYV